MCVRIRTRTCVACGSRGSATGDGIRERCRSLVDCKHARVYKHTLARIGAFYSSSEVERSGDISSDERRDHARTYPNEGRRAARRERYYVIMRAASVRRGRSNFVRVSVIVILRSFFLPLFSFSFSLHAPVAHYPCTRARRSTSRRALDNARARARINLR